MTREPACALLRHIRRLVADVPDPPRDGELLARFTRSRDEDAFAELVRRHGGMVLGVCGSVLRDRQDAEDAFQATFLALARKAHTIRKPGSLAGWLHGVARRIARKLSARAARRPESPAGDLHALPARPMDDLTWREMRAALYEELERLPERNRLPLLLCHLEGQTQDEAARQLGWTLGTLRGRLLRGRELLRARLRRRGLDPSASLLAAVLSQGEASAVPPVLAASVTRSAVSAVAGGAIVSGRVAGLADAALGAMSLARLKAAAAALLVFAMVGSGALAVYSAGEEPPAKESGATPAVATEERAEPEEEESVRTDLLGDPLPRGAVARVGTERLCGMGPIVFLAGGKTLVSGDGLGRVTFWDTQTGKE
ncbi:MAG TPA: sigma-70 family RNA polymerase sigma factor, partial [Gemmataceae bacterium]